MKNPEQYIGYIVDPALKKNWTLYIDGDCHNLPLIAQKVTAIDLFHYDSDKSYSGREFAFNCIEDKLSAEAIVMFDDIQDNFHFRDFVTQRGWSFRIFSIKGKCVGLTGPFIKKHF